MGLDTCFDIVLEQSQRESFLLLITVGIQKGWIPNERGCFWYCSAPDSWSGGPTLSCQGFHLILWYPLVCWVNFLLAELETDQHLPLVHWREVKSCGKQEGKRKIFPLYGAIKPVGSVQTSHEISPRLNWKKIKLKTSRGISLTLWKHTKPKSLCTQ